MERVLGRKRKRKRQTERGKRETNPTADACQQKEPLSRALRGRPFEHEEYMEILYPDVVGSGGAPKRIMKPKRKGPDNIPGADEGEMPGTAVLNLQAESAYGAPAAPMNPHQRQSIGQAAVAVPPIPVPHARPTSTAIPPRTSITSSSALTPPEETTHTRKRFMVPHAAAAAAAATSAPAADPKTSAAGASRGMPAEKRRRISGKATAPLASQGAAAESSSTGASSLPGRQLLEDGLLGLAELLKARTPPKWPEQAMEIFFREFSDEDMDLQLKIAEKVLADDNKAMVFCKMPTALRKHWVKRLREVHNRST